MLHICMGTYSQPFYTEPVDGFCYKLVGMITHCTDYVFIFFSQIPQGMDTGQGPLLQKDFLFRLEGYGNKLNI